MILDYLDSAHRYSTLKEGFAEAFEYLRETDFSRLGPGRYVLEGDNLFARIASGHEEGSEDVKLEAHRKYIDIQYLLKGNHRIGWKNIATCIERKSSYDIERDVELFTDNPDMWINLRPRMFTIFFPEDAHAPVAAGEYKKVLVKLAVDWQQIDSP